jgi:putative hydrolase of the HAD superfamily
LFDVEQYFLGAFKEIALELSKKHNLAEEDIYDVLMKKWKEKTSMYPRLFNDALGELGIDENIPSIVQKFNSYNGKITPYEDVVVTLNILREKGCRIGLISDGNLERQKRKLRMLGINSLFDKVILTAEMDASKPSNLPYKKIISELNEKPENCYYVGDNPKIDFEGAKKTGMNTIRLLKGEFRNFPSNEYIDHEIKEIEEVLKVINFE